MTNTIPIYVLMTLLITLIWLFIRWHNCCILEDWIYLYIKLNNKSVKFYVLVVKTQWRHVLLYHKCFPTVYLLILLFPISILSCWWQLFMSCSRNLLLALTQTSRLSRNCMYCQIVKYPRAGHCRSHWCHCFAFCIHFQVQPSIPLHGMSSIISLPNPVSEEGHTGFSTMLSEPGRLLIEKPECSIESSSAVWPGEETGNPKTEPLRLDSTINCMPFAACHPDGKQLLSLKQSQLLHRAVTKEQSAWIAPGGQDCSWASAARRAGPKTWKRGCKE